MMNVRKSPIAPLHSYYFVLIFVFSTESFCVDRLRSKRWMNTFEMCATFSWTVRSNRIWLCLHHNSNNENNEIVPNYSRFRENHADLAISWDTRPRGCVSIRWVCGIGISQTLSLLPVNWIANAAMPLPSSSLPDPTNTWNRNEMQKPSCGTSTTLLQNSEWNSFSSFLEKKRKCERHSQRIRIGPV